MRDPSQQIRQMDPRECHGRLTSDLHTFTLGWVKGLSLWQRQSMVSLRWDAQGFIDSPSYLLQQASVNTPCEEVVLLGMQGICVWKRDPAWHGSDSEVSLKSSDYEA